MPFGQVAGYFLDTCVLLPHSLESISDACSEFLNKAGKQCFISSSVKAEALSLSKEAYSVICGNFRSILKPALERSGIKRITNRDGKVLAKIFSDLKRQTGIVLPTRSNVRNELLGAIENFVCNKVHSMKDESFISIDDLLAGGLAELEKAKYEIEKPFKTTPTIEITPNNKITSMVLLKTLIINERDVENLASALESQYQLNKWVIFVTIDEKDILSKEEELWEIFGLQCTKPGWALDFLNDMTKLKSPVETYQEKSEYSDKQIQFALTVEETLGVKLSS